MKNRYITSIRWKFILLMILSGFLALFITVVFSAFLMIIDRIFSNLYILNSGSAVLSIMALFFVSLFGLYYLFTKKTMSYFEEIFSAVHKISKGDFSVKLYRKTNDEMGDLAVNINTMSRTLKNLIEGEREAERIKNELITSVSHDIRTPLTSIIGYLELIQEDRYKDEVELRHYVDIAYHKSLKLKKLTEELFEYTKLGDKALKLRMTTINIKELIEQLSEEFVPVIDDAGMVLRINAENGNYVVKADGDMIARVFENLIINAVRYGYSGKYVDVSILPDQNSISVTVTSYGNPIPASDLPYIFEKMYRVEKSRSKETGGTGLGLAIAKNIVELHKGNIKAYTIGDATCFEVILPRNP